MKKDNAAEQCPCGLKQSYADCCEPAHQGIPAKTAEVLMRSRYSAFVFGLSDYLLSSWHRTTRPTKDALRLDENANWLGLKIVSTQQGQAGDTMGTVEFVARYKSKGKATRIEEVSEFVFENGCWFYIAGKGKS